MIVALCCHYPDTIVEVRLRQTSYLEIAMSSTGLLEELSEVFSVPGAHGFESSSHAMQLLKHINSLLGLLAQLDLVSLILLLHRDVCDHVSPCGCNGWHYLDLLHLILHDESFRLSMALLGVKLATQEGIPGSNSGHLGNGIVHCVVDTDSQVEHTSIS